MKDLRAKTVDLAQRLEKALYYGDEVRTAWAKAKEVRKNKVEVETQVVKVETASERLTRKR